MVDRGVWNRACRLARVWSQCAYVVRTHGGSEPYVVQEPYEESEVVVARTAHPMFMSVEEGESDE
jgi:hypothetical protein